MAAETPLRTLTKMFWGFQKLIYLNRQNVIKLYSNHRRFKIIYIWMSLKRHCLSQNGVNLPADLEKNQSLKVWLVKQCLKTIQKVGIRIEGVRIFNSISKELRPWTGTSETFNDIWDEILKPVPDQPETESSVLGGKDSKREAQQLHT